VLTLENRVRLVRAVVQRVEVIETKNRVAITLAEVGLGAGGAADDDGREPDGGRE